MASVDTPSVDNLSVSLTGGRETPLSPVQHSVTLGKAFLLALSFYLHSFLIVFLGVFLAFFVAVAFIAIPDFGSFLICTPIFLLTVQMLLVFARCWKDSGWLDDSISLQREDAPDLWSAVDTMARLIEVPSPTAVRISNGVNGSIALHGVRTGKGQSELRIGFDLLAVFSTAQVQALLAHELAHAKYFHRGIYNFTYQALARSNRLVFAFSQLNRSENAFGPTRALAGALGFVPRKILYYGFKALTLSSRYHEFVADRVAAEICGSDDSREMLLNLRVAHAALRHVSWQARAVHLRQKRDYVAWLRSVMDMPAPEELTAAQARGIERDRDRFDEFSTHPSLADRIDAINRLNAPKKLPDGAHRFGIDWLRQPNEIAEKLFRETERLVIQQERSLTRNLEKLENGWFSRFRLDMHQIAQLIVVVMAAFLTYVFVALVLETAGISPHSWPYYTFHCYMAGAILLFLLLQRRKGVEVSVPIPSLQAYRKAETVNWTQRRQHDQSLRTRSGLSLEEKAQFDVEKVRFDEERRVELGRELRPLFVDTGQKSKATARFWAEKGASFLEVCDYERAMHCARLSFENRHQNLSALTIYGICGAARGDQHASQAANNALNKSHRLEVKWALAWAHCLGGNALVGEALLVKLIRQKDHPTLWALLGHCQIENGKLREALESRSHSLELVQKTNDAENEAYHRHDVAKSQVSLGMMDEALAHYQWLLRHQEHFPWAYDERFGLGLDWINWHVGSEDLEGARTAASELSASYGEAPYLIMIGDVLALATSKEGKALAKPYYQKVLENGYYPNVQLSLASLELTFKNKSEARRLVLDALDADRPRPLDAWPASRLIKPALELLEIIDDLPAAKVTAFEAHLDASDTGLKMKDLWLLCYFENESQALAAATEIFEALLPEYELEEWIEVEALDVEKHPEKLRHPGIEQVRWTAE